MDLLLGGFDQIDPENVRADGTVASFHLDHLVF
jgi:hypothetical protein